MTEINELKYLIKENLERRGLIDKIKTEVKTEIFSILSEDIKSENKPKPNLSNENLLINDLIREYLDFNRYNCTSNILLSETGQPKFIMNRKFLCDQLNVEENADSKAVPLLYSLINYFTQRSDIKNFPQLIDKPKIAKENMAIEKVTYLKVDSGRSNMVDSISDSENDGMPRVYSARDFLRERSSYSNSSNSRYD